jgi:hypothetical protein
MNVFKQECVRNTMLYNSKIINFLMRVMLKIARVDVKNEEELCITILMVKSRPNRIIQMLIDLDKHYESYSQQNCSRI